MSTKTKAELFLERLQAQCLLQDKFKGNYLSKEEFLEEFSFPSDLMFQKHREHIFKYADKAFSSKTPTRFEYPMGYHYLKSEADDIEATLRKYGRPLPKSPLIGTLPTGRVNAMVIRVPTIDELIIVFDRLMIIFISFLAEAVIETIPTKSASFSLEEIDLVTSFDLDEIEKNLNNNPELALAFVLGLTGFLLTGSPPFSFTERDFIPTIWSGMLANTVDLFLLGHEYGHIVSGHLSNKQMVASIIGDEEFDEYVFKWGQELEADAAGASLMMSTQLKNYGPRIGLHNCGADFFFTILDIIERGIAVIRTGSTNAQITMTAHPPSSVRRNLIRKYYQETPVQVSEVMRNPMSDFLSLSKQLEQIVESLWERTLPSLQHLYKKGYKLSPIWDGYQVINE